MKIILSVLTSLIFVSLALNSAPAYAYLDPGTGSIILQGFIGAVTALFVFLRLYWYRLLNFLGIKKQENLELETPENEK